MNYITSSQSLTDLLEISTWLQVQDSLSSIIGYEVSISDADGRLLCRPSNENNICRIVKETAIGASLCNDYCGKSIKEAVRKKEPFLFKCHANLYSFTVPIMLDEKHQIVILGGHTFFSYRDFTAFIKNVDSLGIDRARILSLNKDLKFSDSMSLKLACRYINTSANNMLKNTYSQNIFKHKFSQLLTLFNVSTDLSFDIPHYEIYGMILNVLGILFDVNTASIMLWAEDEGIFKTKTSFGQREDLILNYTTDAKKGIFGQIMKEHKAVSTRNRFEIMETGLPAEIQSLHVFPLFKGEGVSGLIAIFNTDISEDDKKIIASFCNQVALVLENLKLKSELQEKLKNLSILMEINKAVGSTLDFEKLLQIILEKSTELAKASQGSLMIYDEEKLELAIKATKGFHEKIVEQFRIKPGEGIAGWVLKEGLPIVVEDIERDERFGKKSRPRYKTRSFISIPLKINSRIVGVLNISDKITGEVFSEDDLNLLLSFATHASIAIERSEYYNKSEVLKKISITDQLTELLNRRYFQERLTEEIERSKRYKYPLSLIILDIDNFKNYNDMNGHLVGDEGLRITASCIRNAVRTMDVVARFGGEEFAVILPQTEKDEANIIAERIRKEVEKTYYPMEETQPNGEFTISLGLATYPDDANEMLELINNADRSMYAAKAQGKNRVVRYSPDIAGNYNSNPLSLTMNGTNGLSTII